MTQTRRRRRRCRDNVAGGYSRSSSGSVSLVKGGFLDRAVTSHTQLACGVGISKLSRGPAPAVGK